MQEWILIDSGKSHQKAAELRMKKAPHTNLLPRKLEKQAARAAVGKALKNNKRTNIAAR